MVDRITETNSTVSYSRCNHDTDRERGKGRERRRIKDVQYTCRSETQTVTLQLHQSHGLFFFFVQNSTNVRGSSRSAGWWRLRYMTTQFIIGMERKLRSTLCCSFWPVKGKVHAWGRCAHLFLNPDDVKGFPFELQLANISPAKNHHVVLFIYVYVS